MDQPKTVKAIFGLTQSILKNDSMQVRNNIIKKLNQYGIQVRPCWKLLHKLKQFSRYPQMNLSMSEKLEKNIINIPSSPIYG